MPNKTVLVIGGAGFIGVNAVKKFIQDDWQVIVFDNLSRPGSEKNIKYLEENYLGKFEFIKGDIVRDLEKLQRAVNKADAIIHLAAQVAVTTSVEKPRYDFEVNALGTLNVLEAARLAPHFPIIIYSSTNKVYGGMEDLIIDSNEKRYFYRNLIYGVPETRSLDFHSPYGCSKGAGDQYARDYFRIYNLPTVVFRQSCVYGPHQFGIEDQGWLAWFIIATMQGKALTIYGDGKQIRDTLYIDDLINLYGFAVNNPEKVKGKVYNIGGGPNFTLSLLELINELEKILDQKIEYNFSDWRPGDQRVYISDIRKAKTDLGWEPKVSPKVGIRKLAEWIKKNKELFN